MRNWNLRPPIEVDSVLKIIKADLCYREININKVDGFYIPLEDGTYIVAINSNKPVTRQRYTIFHEVAHIIMKDYMNLTPSQRDANIFAAEMLIPEEHLRRLISNKEWREIKKLSDFYKVSRKAMEIRISELNLARCIKESPAGAGEEN